jgi:AcrR family transcriptional regulator
MMRNPTQPTPIKPRAAQSTEDGERISAAEPCVRRGRPSLEEAQRLPSRILQAGWEVLAEHGFENFTFDRIARHAHIGKVTIYNRFAGKAEFLEALLKFKVIERRMSILAVGADLPLIEGFYLRAVAVVEIMLSPDGVLMERLLDWCDQELGDGVTNYRLAMYEDALIHIEAQLKETASQQGFVVRDVPLAARFWIEGLLGHARFLGSVQKFDRDETERWARSYSEFYFSAWRA